MTERHYVAFKGSGDGHNFPILPWELWIHPPFWQNTYSREHACRWTFQTLPESLLRKIYCFSSGCPLLIWLILRNKQNVFKCYILLWFQPAWKQVLLYTAVSSYPGSSLHDTFHLLLNSIGEFLQTTARQDQMRVAVLFTARESNQRDSGSTGD